MYSMYIYYIYTLYFGIGTDGFNVPPSRKLCETEGMSRVSRRDVCSHNSETWAKREFTPNPQISYKHIHIYKHI